MLITGGSRGIGAATARLAAKQGYKVAINYLKNEAAAMSVVESIKKEGGDAAAFQADVGSEKEVLSLFEVAAETLGLITVFINNAGILEQQMPLKTMTLDRLERTFRTNITGAFLCAREAVKHMSTKEGGQGGVIINVSSAAARLGSPNEYIDYAATKGAMDTMTLGLAKEVAEEGIRVNAVRPGLIYTDIHASGGEPERIERLKSGIPLKRGGTTEEVAQAILWLASDEAAYITGVLLDISGGR